MRTPTVRYMDDRRPSSVTVRAVILDYRRAVLEYVKFRKMTKIPLITSFLSSTLEHKKRVSLKLQEESRKK
ncbi:hypothetical protein Mapa_000094 [Marchantia paleacea]|nr:hypothetical protein Mapa_000094 [Marchantia paleacea]